jgi:predicted nucleic acid-binding Zn ribbon protein
MPYRLPLHTVTPNYRPDHCLLCHRPLTRSRVGRPRHTCSPACRQALYRKRYNVYSPDDKRWRADARRADVELARLERRFGPFDNTPRDGGLSHRQRLRYRLSRGMPLLYCKVCGRPFVHEANGAGLRYCSLRCKGRYVYRYRRLRKAVYVLHDRPLTEDALAAIRRGEGYEFCAHCEMPYVPNPASRKKPIYCSRACRQAAYYRRRHPAILHRANCAHCGKRFAVHTARHRYCSDRCANRASDLRRRPPKTHFWGQCIVCGVSIHNRLGSGAHRQYCSTRCKDSAHRLRRKQRAEQALGRNFRRCHWCGTALGWQANGRRLYCSESCSQKMHNQNRRLRQAALRLLRPPRQRECEFCGQAFTVSPTVRTRQRFCSKLCRMRAYRANHRAILNPWKGLLPSIFTAIPIQQPMVPSRTPERG